MDNFIKMTTDELLKLQQDIKKINKSQGRANYNKIDLQKFFQDIADEIDNKIYNYDDDGENLLLISSYDD
jgi:hypothetical protein